MNKKHKDNTTNIRNQVRQIEKHISALAESPVEQIAIISQVQSTTAETSEYFDILILAKRRITRRMLAERAAN